MATDVFDTIDATAPPPVTGKGDVFDSLGPEDLPSREQFEASHRAAVSSLLNNAMGGTVAPPIAAAPIPPGLRSAAVAPAQAANVPFSSQIQPAEIPVATTPRPAPLPPGPAFVTPYEVAPGWMPSKQIEEPGVTNWTDNLIRAANTGKLRATASAFFENPLFGSGEEGARNRKALDDDLSTVLVGPFAVQRGMVEAGVETATNPGTLAITAGVGAAGGLADAVVSPYVKAAWHVADLGLNAYFSGQSAGDAAIHGEQAWESIQDGKYEDAARELGFASTDALFAYLGARGAIGKGLDINTGIRQGIALGRIKGALQDEAYRREADRRAQEGADGSGAPAPVQKAIASARAGVEALTPERPDVFDQTGPTVNAPGPEQAGGSTGDVFDQVAPTTRTASAADVFDQIAPRVQAANRAYDAIQADIDAEESRLESQGHDPIHMFDPAQQYGQRAVRADDFPPGWTPMPERLASLYRERFAAERDNDDQLRTGLDDRLQTLIPDAQGRAKLVNTVGQFDRPPGIRGSAGPNGWEDIGRVADDVLKYAAQERGDDGWSQVDARLGGTPESPGVRLNMKFAGGTTRPYGSATVERAQALLDALLGGKAPRYPGQPEAAPGPAQVAAPTTRTASAADVFDQIAPTKPLWEMSPDELDAAATEAKGRDQADLHEFFGPEGAQQYKRLERAANSSLKSPQETDAAYQQLTQMEDRLTPEQRNRLWGVGDTRPQAEEIQNYREALGRVDTSSPGALGDSLKWAVTGVGDKDNPADMTPDERLRYAQLRHGMSEAAAQGWDPVEVSQAAFRGAAGRFNDPEDAAFMLRRFLQPGGQPTAETPALSPPPAQLPSGPQMSTTVEPLGPEQRAEPEKRAVTPTEAEARVPATPPAYGREVTVKVPGETTTYPARYAVRELADVQPSHNAFTFAPNRAFDYTNDRDYDRQQNKARVIKNASPGVYDPAYTTTESPTAEHGAPVVDASGNVLGGNSRSMSQTLVYSYKGGDAEMYKQAIAAKAAQLGIDPAELARFKKPILVREVGPGIDAQKAITDFNKAAPADLAPEEQAVSDGRRLSGGTVAELAARMGDVGEDGSLADALRGEDGAGIVNYLVRDGVLTEQEKGGYLDDRGYLTPEIKQRIAKALVGRLFDNPSEFRNTTPTMRGKLERVAPQVLRLEGRPEWSITDQLREALALTEDAKARHNSLDRHLKQTASAGARSYSPEAVDLARTLEESPVKAGAAFRRYANDEALSREGNQTAFFKPPTRLEAFQDAFGSGGSMVSSTVAPEMSERGGYVVGAGLGTHAALGRFERINLDPEEAEAAHAYVTNPSGIELIHRLLSSSPADYAGMRVGGLHIAAEDMWAVFNRLMNARTRGEVPGIAPGLGQLIRAVKGAAEESRALVVIADYDGKSAAARQRALDEEIGHAMQSGLNYGGNLGAHGVGARSGFLPGERNAFLANPLTRTALRELAARSPLYAQASDGVKMAEVGVRLMDAGRYPELGLSWRQARTLGVRYIQALRQAYGNQSPRPIARRMYRALRSPTAGGGTEHGALPESSGPTGRSGPAGGTGPDLSIVGPAGGPEIAYSAHDFGSDSPSLFDDDDVRRLSREAAEDRAKLEGQRLTAQFASPLSREEQLRKLRAGEQPPQTNLFEATPEKQQFSLFGPGTEVQPSTALTFARLKGGKEGRFEDYLDTVQELAEGPGKHPLAEVASRFAAQMKEDEGWEPGEPDPFAGTDWKGLTRDLLSQVPLREDYLRRKLAELGGPVDRAYYQAHQFDPDWKHNPRERLSELLNPTYGSQYEDILDKLENAPPEKRFSKAFTILAKDAAKGGGEQRGGLATVARMFVDAVDPAKGNWANPDAGENAGERGGIKADLLTLGAGKFITEDVVPAAKRIASNLVEAQDQAARMLAPQTRGAAAAYTGLNLRQRMSQFAQRFDQGTERLKDARAFFNTRSPADNYQFIDNVERGLGRGAKPGDAELEPIARMFSKMLDQRRQEVQALGEGALKGFYQNYFPHIFERPEQATKFVESFFSGRRNMEGPKSFLKHREFPTFREALDAGLKPVSDNPVDLVILKVREMDRYLLAHAVLRDLAENGIAKRVSGLGPDARQREMMGGAPIRPEWAVEKTTDLPPNFKSIRDPVGGGRWYAEEGAAEVLNNYLSVGLRTRSGLARTLIGVNNVMNQSNLGLSAFHLRAVTISSMAGRMGLGFVKAMEGHPVDAAWHVFTSPGAPFLDYMKGSKMLHDWFKPGSEGAPIAAMTDALMKGGGRAGQAAEYSNQMAEKMMQAFRRGNFLGGVIRSPFAAVEAMSKPLMQHLVPRMKMGAFADIAAHELEKLGPGAKVEDVRRALAAVWDHVENRLGQMTYDNLFWHRTLKDTAHLVVRSVGWNLGDLKEVYSGARAITGVAGSGGRAVLMRDGPEGWSKAGRFRQMRDDYMGVDKHGLGFVMAYAVVAAIMGAIMQYLHTGHGPQELKDYFWPKREDGRRMVSAPYVKDAYQMVRDPAGTLIHKTGPLVNTLAEMIANKDYYDRPIRNLDDPIMKQLEQEAQFVGRQFLPFTLQSYVGNTVKHPRPLAGGNTPEHKAENFLGVTPAPAPLQPGYRPKRDAHR